MSGGNNRQTVFRSDADRIFYLDLLRRKARQHSLRVLGYCLMTNHVHLVVVPEHQESLALALGQAHMTYAQRFNHTGRRSGHLWQNRFYSCPVGSTHLIEALLYVDLNPVRARIIDRATAYPWSSANAHVSHSDSSDLLDMWEWSELDNITTGATASNIRTMTGERHAGYAGPSEAGVRTVHPSS